MCGQATTTASGEGGQGEGKMEEVEGCWRRRGGDGCGRRSRWKILGLVVLGLRLYRKDYGLFGLWVCGFGD